MGAPAALKLTPSSKPLVFALNGQRVELASVDPATTLLSYIRSETRFKGPKRGCGEGGCGACVVMLARYNPQTKEVKESSVNSCLVMLCSVDGCAITTTEGLCKTRNDFHAVHKRISAFHGSQCGFCTPGMSMAIYGCLKHDQQQQAAQGIESPTRPSCEKLERALQGNICRCTGYRPLLDVCKTFASDVDLEDLGVNTCWTDKAGAKEENLPVYDPKSDPQFPQFLIDELETPEIHSNGNAEHAQLASLDARFTHVERSKEGESERAWVSTSSLADLTAALEALSGRNQKVKLVVGNTSAGYYKDLRQVDVFVDISQIPELLTVRRDARGLELGAATRIAELVDYLEEWSQSPVAEALADHLKKLAGGHVRNWGSVGGNLVMAQKFGFASDVATVLLGAGASVKVVALKGFNADVTELSLEEFLEKGSTLGENRILQSVYIPLESGPTETVFKTFRGAPRPYGNALSFANAAFLVQVSRSEQNRTVVIQTARLAFGAFGTKHAIRALRVEELLKGKSLTLGLVKEAVEVLKTDVVPLEETPTKDYRVSLVVGFLFDFLNSLLSGEPTLTPTHLFPHIGKQQFTVSDEHYPISQPTSKFQSQNQASGEAVYVDDIPSPPGCLHAAFVLSSEPYAKIKGVDSAAALGSVGAVAYVSASDIPGKNIGIINPFNQEKEPLFVDEIVGYVGQPLGVVVADTYDNARIAAGKVNVNYDTHSVGAPVMTCDDAVAKNSFFSIPPMFVGPPIGEIEKGLSAADFKSSATVSTKSQNHFYMETQTTLAIPDEDGCITIYTASQSIDCVQQVIAACLGIPIHNVRVITRRLGGGFGGKGFRNQQIAAAVAVAAYKLRRPIRISLDRNTDMQMIGGRFLTKTNYTVGFTKTGKITALKADVLMEAGWFIDATNVLPMTITNSLKKYNYGSMNINYILCKTNNVPKTAMRAPGDCEGSAIADAVLDHVASYLGLSGNKVRDVNLHTLESVGQFHGDAVGDANGFTLPIIWNRLKSRLKMEEREKEIEVFNEQSRWIKRGLSMVTCTFHALAASNIATVSIFQDGSIVVEVGGVEMGQGLYTKVRQAVAYCLSPLWNKSKDVDMLGMIRVIQADSLSLPNSFCDGGSTTSEGTCAAAQKACVVLVQRLQPVKEQLAKNQADGMVTWELLCLTAKQMQVDMQSHEQWSPVPMASYLVYGVGASEVEVNTLTGETRILATNLIHDGGKSLNPAVDIGQIEGAFVMGAGYFLTEDVVRDAKGKLLSDGTWTYKPPTIDTIPQKFNVELYNSPTHKDRIFSSKGIGEPPLTLATSVFSAVRYAIQAARKDYFGGTASGDMFEFSQPATTDKVKSLCGLDNVEQYLEATLKRSKTIPHGKLS